MRRLNQKGFTAVELLVGMSVFIVVLSIAVGVFVRGLRLQRQTVALIAVNDTVGLALEQMAREIRPGGEFVAGTEPEVCPTSAIGNSIGECFSAPDASSLTFTSVAALGQSVTYARTNDSITRSENGGLPIPITSENVEIADLQFYLRHLQPPASPAYRITVVVAARSADPDPGLAEIEVRLQTTVSAL